MNAELQVAIDTAIDAMHTTKVLFDLGEDHILSSALRKLAVAVDAEDIKYETQSTHPWLVRDRTGRHLDQHVESEARAKEMARHYQACDPLAEWVVIEVRK